MPDLLRLSTAAERVYRQLLVAPAADFTALCTAASIDEQTARACLDELEGLGLVEASMDSPTGVHAHAPEVAMEALLAKQHASLAAQQLELELSRAAAAQLVSAYSSSRPTPSADTEQLLGLTAIRRRLEELAQRAEESVWTFAPGGAHAPGDLEASRDPNRELLARGVRSRTIYLDSVRNDPATSQHLKDLASLGAEVRTCPSLPIRMVIFDGRHTVLPIDTTDAKAGAVVLSGPAMVAALTALFESVWASAAPLGARTARGAHDLLPQEQATLHLLAAGHTDEFVARRLGVSQRTARRIAADLMQRLAARSRFEAGVLAERQGWFSS